MSNWPRSRAELASVIALVALIAAGCAQDAKPKVEPGQSQDSSSNSIDSNETGPSPYADLRATGRAREVIEVGRRQLRMPYVYGAGPRYLDGIRAMGRRPHRDGFDCSSFVAYVYHEALGEWIGGNVAHTDEIWTQGGAMPLTSTPASTSQVIRGMSRRTPPGGYQVGDIVFRRTGSGGYWGHVAIVSDGGRILESFPPDVHETRILDEFLDEDGATMGWMRLRSLDGPADR